jgi:hypothetical protein
MQAAEASMYKSSGFGVRAFSTNSICLLDSPAQ